MNQDTLGLNTGVSWFIIDKGGLIIMSYSNGVYGVPEGTDMSGFGSFSNAMTTPCDGCVCYGCSKNAAMMRTAGGWGPDMCTHCRYPGNSHCKTQSCWNNRG